MGIDVITRLQHIALVTYAIEPGKIQNIPRGLHLDTVIIEQREKALLSLVTFMNVDFHPVIWPWPKFSFGQTNYRVYVVDSSTGEHGVWFLETFVDSWLMLLVPRLWHLPWRQADIRFSWKYDPSERLYKHYDVTTTDPRAPLEISVSQQPGRQLDLPGFSDTAAGVNFLTQPLVGYYLRPDGRQSVVRVWHRPFSVAPASLQFASCILLERMGLVDRQAQQKPHSILLEHSNEFTVYLPPKVGR
jgi:hypothetical protein